MTEAIPWDELRNEARQAADRAYAPYSGLRVGAAGVVDDGEIVTGCNVENASYGLTLCAECGLVSDLHDSGGGRLVAVAIVAGDGEALLPCGRCRQLLIEHGGGDCLIDSADGPRRLDSLLPSAFTDKDLEERRDD
ncbi:MAG TPA: cytidine deaminase [Actinomycetota bacterium]|nr:cytidine deaminase [Actinomycetota bacterium]